MIKIRSLTVHVLRERKAKGPLTKVVDMGHIWTMHGSEMG